MIKGALIFNDYLDLINEGYLINKNYKKMQIQPSSIDLSLSEECYEIKASFLSPKSRVRETLEKNIIKKIDLKNNLTFKKNTIYLFRLNEKLNLSNNIFGKCNPKSSTGRLDIFCRTILDYCDEYEKVPKNYKGEIFLEVTSKSFNIEFNEGDSLNQMRLTFNSNDFINDETLLNIHKKTPIVYNNINKLENAEISNGLKISVDLDLKKNICAYVAKNNTPTLKFNKLRQHKIEEFWKSIKISDKSFVVETGKFYILKSKQKIRIPNNMAGEMVPYDTSIGDFRVHYAGFFDPGFGNPNGTFAVLEVKTNEVPFVLEDGQMIARIRYERLNKESKVVYGSNINSNYQNQGLSLSKHFEVNKDI